MGHYGSVMGRYGWQWGSYGWLWVTMGWLWVAMGPYGVVLCGCGAELTLEVTPEELRPLVTPAEEWRSEGAGPKGRGGVTASSRPIGFVPAPQSPAPSARTSGRGGTSAGGRGFDAAVSRRGLEGGAWLNPI